jgi:hypothetical protein
MGIKEGGKGEKAKREKGGKKHEAAYLVVLPPYGPVS